MARTKNTAGSGALPKAFGVIYARYSSHSQKEESIEQQVEECMAFAEANNIQIIEVYADKAISGKTDKRSSFQRMMRDAEKRKFSVVIAYKSNRIARNMLNALSYENKLESFGIRTCYAKEEFGNTAASRFALRTMMNVNQFYSENMAEDIKRGMMDNAEACKVNGRLPFGYKNVDGFYALDEVKAPVVAEIFKRFLDGETFVAIAADLNQRGFRTSLGNPWNKGSFHRLLSNENYIGTYKYAGVIKEHGIPAIVSEEVFHATQEKLVTKGNPQGRKRTNVSYLLTGKLKCGHCNSFMSGFSATGRHGGKFYYYGCADRRSGGSCKKEHVRKDFIEHKVAELTKAVVLQDDVIEWLADNVVKVQLEAMKSPEFTAMKDQLAEKKKAAKNIMAAIEQGIITATTKDRLLELEAEIDALEKSLAVARRIHKPIDKERIIYALEQYRDGDLDDKSYQAKLISNFVRTVYVWDDKIRIDYHFEDEGKTYPINQAYECGPEGFAQAPLSSTKQNTIAADETTTEMSSFLAITLGGNKNEKYIHCPSGRRLPDRPFPVRLQHG